MKRIQKKTHNRSIVIRDKSSKTVIISISTHGRSKACREKLSIGYALEQHYEEKKPNK